MYLCFWDYQSCVLYLVYYFMLMQQKFRVTTVKKNTCWARSIPRCMNGQKWIMFMNQLLDFIGGKKCISFVSWIIWATIGWAHFGLQNSVEVYWKKNTYIKDIKDVFTCCLYWQERHTGNMGTDLGGWDGTKVPGINRQCFAMRLRQLAITSKASLSDCFAHHSQTAVLLCNLHSTQYNTLQGA